MWGKLRDILVFAVLCGIVTAGGFGAVAGTAGGQNQDAPLADAGLDQTVPLGATVYLDGGGSVAPDGELVAFEWAVETPGGVTTAHDCLDGGCVQASFDPSQTGVYTVTLTVTDDGGQSASDTLYVTVTEEEPPSVTLTGPDTLQVGEGGTFELDGERGDNFLSAVTWRVDGDRADRFFVDDERTWEFTRAFDQPGTYTVSGTLADVIGLSATAKQTVQVESNTTNRFEVDVTTNSPVVEGETALVTATIENTGEETATQEIVYDGPPANTARTVTLEGGQSTTETVEWETGSGDAGEYPVAVSSRNDTGTATIEVINGTGTTPYFDVEITNVDTPVEVGNDLVVETTITNIGTASDTQTVSATVSGKATESEITLAEGDSTERTFTFGTTGETPGQYTVGVSSENTSDTSPVSLIDPDETIKVVEILGTSGDNQPDTVDDDYIFGVRVKNTGEDETSSEVVLQLADDGTALATAQTATLGVDESDIIRPEEMEFSEAPAGDDGGWGPTGSNGWHEYDGEEVTVVATTDTWDDQASQRWTVPALPEFEIEIDTIDTTGSKAAVDSTLTQGTIENVGDLEGEVDAALHLADSEWTDGISPITGNECTEDCTVEPGEKDRLDGLELDAGETYPFDTTEQLRYHTNNFNEKKDSVRLQVRAINQGSYAGEQPDDTDFATTSWERFIESPTQCEKDESYTTLIIEPEANFKKMGQPIYYEVYNLECSDGVLSKTQVPDDQYTASYHPNSEGGANSVQIDSAKVRGFTDSGVEDCSIRYAWQVNLIGEDVGTAAGATWVLPPEVCETDG